MILVLLSTPALVMMVFTDHFVERKYQQLQTTYVANTTYACLSLALMSFAFSKHSPLNNVYDSFMISSLVVIFLISLAAFAVQMAAAKSEYAPFQEIDTPEIIGFVGYILLLGKALRTNNIAFVLVCYVAPAAAYYHFFWTVYYPIQILYAFVTVGLYILALWLFPNAAVEAPSETIKKDQ